MKVFCMFSQCYRLNDQKQICKISFVLAQLAASLSLIVNQSSGKKKKNNKATWQATRNVPLCFHHKCLKDFCKVSCDLKALGYPGC